MTTKEKIREALKEVFGERINYIHESTKTIEQGFMVYPVFFRISFYSDIDHTKLLNNLASRGLALLNFSFSALRDAKVRVSLMVC